MEEEGPQLGCGTTRRVARRGLSGQRRWRGQAARSGGHVAHAQAPPKRTMAPGDWVCHPPGTNVGSLSEDVQTRNSARAPQHMTIPGDEQVRARVPQGRPPVAREGINFASASKQSTTVRSEEATTCCGRCKGTVDGEVFEHKALVFPTWPTKSLRTKTAPKADIHITCESVIASLLEVQQARTSATYSKGSLIVHELLLLSVSSDPQAHVHGPCLRSCPHILARTRRKST